MRRSALPELSTGLRRRLEAIARRHEEVARELSSGITDSATLRRLGQELNALEPIVSAVAFPKFAPLM